MGNISNYYLYCLISILSSCTSTSYISKMGSTTKYEYSFNISAFSFYRISAHKNVEYRIGERGLRDSVFIISRKVINSYFQGKEIKNSQNLRCLDYKMHRENLVDKKWEYTETYSCLRNDTSAIEIHMLFMFEDFQGSSLALYNQPLSWIGVRIVAIRDNKVLINKYIYDAFTISRRQERMMMEGNGLNNPYFPNEQIFRVMDRVFTYLQKELK